MRFIRELAAKYGVEVSLKPTGGPDGYLINGTIVLDPELYPPRMNWVFCHELAHHLLKHPDSKKITPEMEREADSMAAELMLPAAKFRQVMALYDIPELKALYTHASWEAIARRWAEMRPAVLTIYDNEQFTNRQGPKGLNFPSRPTPQEIELVRDCFQNRKHLTGQVEGLALRSYYVEDTPGRRRVILLTEMQD